jgi:hypothetical protein
LISWISLLAVAVAPNGYVGARVCAGCHPAQSAAQAKTGHAHALSPADKHPLAERVPESFTAYRPEDYRLEWSKWRTRASDSQNAIDVPAEWAFGAGDQAVTFVGQLNEDNYLEHHLSFYRSTGGLAPTPGHRTLRPADLRSATGVLYPTFDSRTAILRCFQCHSTGPLRLAAGMRVQPSEPGVRCESCHGPGKLHSQTRRRDAIFNPARLDAGGLNKFCGTCHRPPAAEDESIDWTDPWNTRHQPVYLTQSGCFLKGKADCRTCHDPHAPLRRNDAAFYDAKCYGCHKTTSQACKASDCTSCHMPKVAPQPELRFVNHWIGVYDSKSPLKPVRASR